MSQDFTACKNHLLASMHRNTSPGLILIPFAYSFCLLSHDFAGRIARELWSTTQDISSVEIIIPPWFSTLMGDEQ
jgi:hypothetical protein